MASSYLGPESPRPLAVISEGYRNHYRIPMYSEFEKYEFGKSYDEKMFDLIHKYLELGTTDRLCYVGESKGSFAERIADKFCLLEPVMTVIPGHYSYVETDTQKVLSIRIAHTGSEEYFRQNSNPKNKEKSEYDKVILKDAIRYFENPVETFQNIMKCVSDGGKMLIIHRPGNLATLPFFNDARQRLEDNETPYMDIIRTLQSCDLDIEWEIECLPIILPKRKWFSMLREKFPPQMEILSDYEILSGVRELSEGILKYEGSQVEFMDRLLFITVSKSEMKEGMSKIVRHGQSPTSYPDLRNLRLSMEVTPEIRPFVKPKKDKKEYKFPWS